MLANYYKPGPATKKNVRSRIAEPSAKCNERVVGILLTA